MSDKWEYLLNSAGWFLGGIVASSVWWRVYFHRKMVASGEARREPRLSVFVAVMALLMMTASVLFTQASQIALRHYVACQAVVNQSNADAINDRSDAAVRSLRNEAATWVEVDRIVRAAPQIGNREKLHAAIGRHIRDLLTRARDVQQSPLQPVKDCKPPAK